MYLNTMPVGVANFKNSSVVSFQGNLKNENPLAGDLSTTAFYGGSYDPIHNGHLISAGNVLEQVPDTDKVVFVVCANPGHKQYTTAYQQRLDMVNLAIRSNPKFKVSDIERQIAMKDKDLTTVTDEFGFEKGVTYLYKTVINIIRENNRLNGRPLDTPQKINFVSGADSFASMDEGKWQGRVQFPDIIKFILMRRPGSPEFEDIKSKLSIGKNPNLETVEVAPLQIDLSSSLVRKKCTAGDHLTGIVPESVEQYIRSRNLYKNALKLVG